ncbi:hypothetical protein ANCDUO_06865 [Ancylostoma duodenale]|uniref:Uncharacterized protein n=1 Tax=Ancylostoma duodenale TaxID=51022 RepID=A0A0C2GV30_9BILA|nr:hypothetical protein ANCDUO_06865 [Ancylostoma duodenale]
MKFLLLFMFCLLVDMDIAMGDVSRSCIMDVAAMKTTSTPKRTARESALEYCLL